MKRKLTKMLFIMLAMITSLSLAKAQSFQINCTVVQHASCNGLCDGKAIANPNTPGTYTYEWSTSPSQTNNLAAGLCAGAYTVTVTNGGGASVSCSFTITQPPPLILTITVDPNCCCDSGFVNCPVNVAVAGGTSPYSYLWNSGTTTQNLIGPLACPGTYTLTVTDVNGCTATASVSFPTGNCCKINCPDTVIICFDVPDSIVFLGIPQVILPDSCTIDSIWNNVLNIYELWNNTVDNKSMFSHLDVGINLVKWKVKFANGSEDSCIQVVIKNPKINAVIQFTANGIPATTTTTICLNDVVTFADISTNMAPGKRGWLINDGSIPNGDQTYKHRFTVPGTWTITLTVYDACKKPYTLISTIIVDPAQGPELDCYANVVCNGDTAIYTCTNICGTYNWTVTGGTIISPNPINTTSKTITVLWGNGTPQGKISLSVSGCTPPVTCPNPSIWVINIVPPALDIAGKTTVCQDLYESYSVTCIPGTNYDWTIVPPAAGDIISGQGDHDIAVHWGKNYSGPATINLAYQNVLNGCGNTDCEGSGCEGIGTLTVNVLPVFNITGPTKLCKKNIYSFAVVPAAIVTWDILDQAGNPVTWPGGDINLYNWDLPEGKYLLQATFNNNPQVFCNDKATLAVEVISVPNPIIDGEILVCPDPASYIYTVIPNKSNVTYLWTIVGADVATAIGNSVTVKWSSAGAHTISLKQTLIDAPFCESETETKSISLYAALPEVVVTGPIVACKQDIKTYSTGSVTDGTYSWSISPPAAGKIISGSGTNSIDVQWIEVTDPDFAYVKVKTSLCTADSDSIAVKVYALPDPVIISPSDPICTNTSVSFSTSATGALAWAFTGGTPATSNLSSVNVVYTIPGTYNVTLTETNTHNCTATNTIQIIVNGEPPIPVLTPTPACESSIQTYLFAPAAAFDGAIYKWSVADPAKGQVIASTTTSATVQWNKGSTGTNNLILDIQSLCLNTSIFYPVTVSPIPDPVITVLPPICVNQSNQYFGAPNSATQYDWTFEEGTPLTSILQNPNHIFNSIGTKTITLTVTKDGCTAKTSAKVDVKPLPDISYTFIGTKTCSGINGTIYIVNAPGYSFEWDNNPALNLNALAITNYGPHTVKVTNSEGCEKTLIINIPPSICPGPLPCTPISPLPTLSFTTTLSACSDVNFSPNINGPYDPTKLFWDFGDGSNFSSILSPTHHYSNAGKYLVTLLVTTPGLDTNGDPCEAGVKYQVEVIIPIKPDFDVEYFCDGSGNIKTKVIDRSPFFGPATPNPIATWDWYDVTVPANPILIHNATTSSNSGFDYAFPLLASPNKHFIKLVITTTQYGGAICEITKSFDVPIPVVPSFTADPLCLGTPVEFTNTSSDIPKIVSVEWNFGDPNLATSVKSNDNAPKHIYPLANPYTVTLSVKDVYGCSQSISNVITIAPLTVGSITGSPGLTGCGSVILTSNPNEPANTDYSWSNGTNGQGVNSISATKSGFYYVKVNPNPGCAYSNGPVTVTIKPLPEALITGKLGYCPGENLDLKTPSGNLYSYVWEYYNGTNWVPVPGASNSSSLTTAAGSHPYRVTVTNTDPLNGCSKVSNVVVVVVDVPPSPLIILSSVLPILGKVIVCADQIPVILEPLAAHVAGYTYQWSNITPPPTVTATSRTYDVMKTGKYTATIITTNNCIYPLDTIDVTVNQLPEAIIFGKLIYCEGEALELRGNAGAGLSYEWRKGANPVGNNTILLIIDPVSLTDAGTYTLKVTDANNCTKESSVIITVNPTPLKPFIEAHIGSLVGPIALPPLCADQLYFLLITTASQTPGLLPTDYTWNNKLIGISIPANIADDYFVTAEKNGCKSKSDTISIHPIPDLSCVPTGCYELCDTCLPVTIPGPDGFTTYNWQRSIDGVSNWVNYPPFNSKDLLITGTACYYYRLTVTNQWNCSNTSDLLKVCFKNCCPDTCHLAILTDCNSGSISLCTKLTGNCCAPPYTYLWSGPSSFIATTSCINVTTAGTYTVTVTCSSTGIYTASIEVNPARNGNAVVTNASNATIAFNGSVGTGFVVGLVNIKNSKSQPLNTNWVNPKTSDPGWIFNNLGEVFGIAHDNAGNIFVTATTLYGPTTFTAANPGGGVYRINALSNTITRIANLPNSAGPYQTAGSGCSLENATGAEEPGLGNICYDKLNGQLLVTNFEDGKIYRINAVSGGVIGTPYDPMTTDNSAPGFAPLGERLWGIGISGATVYYSVWTSDRGRNNGPNTIRSVGLNSIGDFLPATDLVPVITLPSFNSGSYSNPVSDIEFPESGTKMLLAEKSMSADMKSNFFRDPCWAHQGRVLEYEFAGTWNPSGNTFLVGLYNSCPGLIGAGSSGGVDYGYDGVTQNNDSLPVNCDSMVWAMGDAVHYNVCTYSDRIYGLQGMHATGNNSIDNSCLIDLDGITGNLTDKSLLGDVDVITCCAGIVCYSFSIGDTLWIDTNKDGLQTSGEPAMAPTPVLLFEEISPGVFVQVGSTTSNAVGYYNFNASNVTGGIKQFTNYKIRIGVGFNTFVLTQYHAGFGTFPTKDNDAIFNNGWTEINYNTGNCPDINNDLDFGFCEVSSPLVIIVVNDNGSCTAGHSGEICVDASICLTCSPTDVYTYNWSNGATVSCITGLSAGLYTVTVTDVTVGWFACPQTIYVDSLPSVKLTADCNNTLCAVAGGGCSNYTYQWSAPSFGNNSCVSPVIPGTTYTVTVTDANGITATKSIMAPYPLHIICFPGTLNCFTNTGSFGVSILGGTPPFVTTLKKNGVPINSAYTNYNQSQLFNITGAGYYCIYVTDANGCIDSCCANITFPVIIVHDTLVYTPCPTGLSDSVTVVATGGTGPYTYTWSDGSTLRVRYHLPQGGYTVTVTDVNGCTGLNTVTISGPPEIIITSAVTNVTCTGGNNGSVSVTASGGTPPYTYIWNNGSTNANRLGLTTGTYTVTVTDAHGCTKTKSVTINALNSIPTQPTGINGPAAVCKNSFVTYTVSVVAGATSYIWTATSGATVFSGQGSTTVVISFSNAATNASLSVVANNVCGSSGARTLAYVVSSVIPASPATINGSLYGLCNLTSVVYNCPAVPNATSYLWTVPAGVTILTGQGTNSITVKYTGAFTNTGSLSVVAQSGCGNSAACTRTVNAKPQQPVITGQNWACKNQPGLIYSIAPVTGATSYTWTVVPGSALVSGQGTTSIVVNWGPVNGIIYCKANNACGSSIQASKPVSFTCKEEGDLFDFSELSLYPNPTSASVTLQFDGFVDGKGQLMVFDLVGQEVLSKTLNVAAGDNRYQLDVASFPKGIYSIKVVYNGMTRNEKLIVQ